MNQNSKNNLWKSFAPGERRSQSIDEYALQMLAECPDAGSDGMCNDEDGVFKAESLDTMAYDAAHRKNGRRSRTNLWFVDVFLLFYLELRSFATG